MEKNGIKITNYIYIEYNAKYLNKVKKNKLYHIKDINYLISYITII